NPLLHQRLVDVWRVLWNPRPELLPGVGRDAAALLVVAVQADAGVRTVESPLDAAQPDPRARGRAATADRGRQPALADQRAHAIAGIGIAATRAGKHHALDPGPGQQV